MKSTKDNIIHINNEYAVQGDEYNITLLKKRIVKSTGHLQYDNKGSFPGYEQLLHRLVDMEIQPLNNIKLITEKIIELKKDITDLINNMPENPSRAGDKEVFLKT